MSHVSVAAYIGLGSNLDRPRAQVGEALRELGELPKTRLIGSSSLYRSHPLGPAGQPDYINAVAALHTRLTADALLEALQQIEDRHGRIRRQRWGARTLDLDLLLYGVQRIDRPHLKVPHPEMTGRAFVMIPLHEIAPGLEIPGRGKVSELLTGLDARGVQRV